MTETETERADALAARLATLEAAPTPYAWPGDAVAALGRFIAEASPVELYRLNPLMYARVADLEDDVAIDLFLHAARVGLFEIGWHAMCRGCGAVVASFHTLKSLHNDFFCRDCDRTRETVLDDDIEVSFTVHPQVRRIPHHEPASLPLEPYFFEHYFSRSILLERTGQRFVDFLRAHTKVLTEVPAGARQERSFEVPPDGHLCGSPRLLIRVDGALAGEAGGGEPLHVELGAPKHVPEVRPGPLTLQLANPAEAPARVFLYFTSEVPYFDYLPFLSAKRLLSAQSFLDLYDTEVVEAARGLVVRDLTLLFTDLKGSTALYARSGDLAAFELITRHFERLGAVIREHHGALVKTIGDAVMATFIDPADAVRAAAGMHAAIAAFNAERGAHDLSLKIGLHRGPTIAVTVGGNLDYFGQTVNIAARVEGLADGGQTCLTESVYAAAGVDAALEGRTVAREDTALRGVGDTLPVYRVG